MFFSIIIPTILFFLTLIEVLLHLIFFSLYFIITYFNYFNFYKFIKDLTLFNEFIKIYFYTIFIFRALKGFLIFIISIELSVYECCLLETFLVLLSSLHYEGSLDSITFSIEIFYEKNNLNYLTHNDLNRCDLKMKALPENSVLFTESITGSESESGDSSGGNTAIGTASSPNLNNNNNKEEPRLLGTWTGYNIVQKNIPSMELINSKFQPPTIKPTMEVTPTGEVIYHYPNAGPAPAPTFEEIMIWRGYRSW